MMNGVDEEGGQFLKVEEGDNNEMVANEETSRRVWFISKCIG
jgi:hypothetical protein